MFETATLSYGPPSKRVWTTFAGVAGQALLVIGAVLAPMISPQVLPRAAWIATITAPGPPPPAPPHGPVVRPRTAVSGESQFFRRLLIMPTRIPPKALSIEDELPLADIGGGVPGGVQSGDSTGAVGGLLTSILGGNTRVVPVVRPPAPPVSPTPKSVSGKPSRVSMIEMARPIHRVEPVYPSIAKQARVAGVVELQGVIGTDGHIHELKVLSGHPLLVKAAVDAVSQWIYAPTILNGQAVEVAAPITVTFKLNGP
jgi:periplasmic protein TonB